MTHDAAEIVGQGPPVQARDSKQDGLPIRSVLTVIRGPETRSIVFALVLALGALMLVLISPEGPDLGRPFGSMTFLGIAFLFGVFELSVINVHFKRETLTFALNEIPIAFAFVFLGPVAAPLARIPFTLAVLALVRRNPGYKLVFNVAVHVFEVALAGLLFRSMIEWLGSGPVVVVSTTASVLLIMVPITLVAIATAISFFEGNLRARITGEFKATWWLLLFNAVLAAMTIALALFEPVLTVLAVLPVLGMWYVLRAYGSVSQELRDLDDLHGFAGRVGDTLDVESIGNLAVDEAMRMFRASGAALVRFSDNDPVVHAIGSLSLGPGTSVNEREWLQLVDSVEDDVLSRSRLGSLGLLAHSSITVGLLTPVRDGGEAIAVLVIARNDVVHQHFEAGDRARLHNIARQLSVSLRRGMLHERLEWEARHDALTGLPSRTLFERTVDNVTGATTAGTWYVMMLDLDRFKEVNDTLGHHAGDALLIEFSRRMTTMLSRGDSLARLAGDEFAILCQRHSYDEIVELAQQCVVQGGRPVTLDGLEIVVTVSIGVAEIISTDRKAIEPMRRADIAMYNAKWQRTGVEFYRDEIDRRPPARLSILGDLRTAIETDQLTVVYQPKLDIGTGNIVGAEALVRWDHPVRGKVPPAEFVRVAEDTGLIKQLTDLVLAQGIEMLARFQSEGLLIGLAVNLSTHDLFDSRLPDRVRGYLESNNVEPSLLTLEITESSLFVDAPRTRATIDGLFQVGIRMAVDDFGTGYSSLSYLRRLPVHELKIDQSFVGGMLTDPQDEVIVRSTVDLGHNLGLKVVAEGVESFDILDRLREFGCDVAQGYAISEPVLSSDIVDWLHRPGHRAWQATVD